MHQTLDILRSHACCLLTAQWNPSSGNKLLYRNHLWIHRYPAHLLVLHGWNLFLYLECRSRSHKIVHVLTDMSLPRLGLHGLLAESMCGAFSCLFYACYLCRLYSAVLWCSLKETIAGSSFPEVGPKRQHKAKTHSDTNTDSKRNNMEQHEKIWRSNHHKFLGSLGGVSLASQMLGLWAQHGPAAKCAVTPWPSMKINDFGRLGGGCDGRDCLLACAKGHSQQSSKICQFAWATRLLEQPKERQTLVYSARGPVESRKLGLSLTTKLHHKTPWHWTRYKRHHKLAVSSSQTTWTWLAGPTPVQNARQHWIQYFTSEETVGTQWSKLKMAAYLRSKLIRKNVATCRCKYFRSASQGRVCLTASRIFDTSAAVPQPCQAWMKLNEAD